MASSSEAGGFFHPTLPSPPLSAVASPSAAPSVLPLPRARPLQPGSTKESNFIEYVDRKLLEISGQYENRHKINSQDGLEPGFKSKGYKNFNELATDLENLIDIIWVSGTRMRLNLIDCSRC